MAYRRSNGKARIRKIEPAVQTLYFTTTPTTSQDPLMTDYIDLSQCASLVNRRFYRQGINWMVAGIKIISSVNSSVIVRSLPTTWVMRNAWKKSYYAWDQMIDNATDEAGSESVKGRFLDFKVFADEKHHNQGVAANLLPNTLDDTLALVPASSGQWQMSTIEIPKTFPAAGDAGETTEFELIAVGANDPGAGASTHDAKSIIQGYADSRALPVQQDPNVPVDASRNWMMRLFSEGSQQSEAVTNMLESTGDNPPYPFEGDVAGTPDTMYPGGETQLPYMQVHDVATITGTTVGGITRIKGGEFPCGLIRIDHATLDTSGNLAIQIDLVPGPHRGYLCENMLD